MVFIPWQFLLENLPQIDFEIGKCGGPESLIPVEDIGETVFPLGKCVPLNYCVFRIDQEILTHTEPLVEGLFLPFILQAGGRGKDLDHQVGRALDVGVGHLAPVADHQKVGLDDIRFVKNNVGRRYEDHTGFSEKEAGKSQVKISENFLMPQ